MVPKKIISSRNTAIVDELNVTLSKRTSMMDERTMLDEKRPDLKNFVDFHKYASSMLEVSKQQWQHLDSASMPDSCDIRNPESYAIAMYVFLSE